MFSLFLRKTYVNNFNYLRNLNLVIMNGVFITYTIKIIAGKFNYIRVLKRMASI